MLRWSPYNLLRYHEYLVETVTKKASGKKKKNVTVTGYDCSNVEKFNLKRYSVTEKPSKLEKHAKNSTNKKTFNIKKTFQQKAFI